MASGVPKFTSFRPKPTPKESTEPTKGLPEPEKRARREKPSRERIPEKNSVRGEDQRQFDPSRGATSSKYFFSDRRGDIDIVRYGSINRYDVPSYRRFGYGFVLGIPLHRKVDRDLSTEKVIVLTPATKRRVERLLTKKYAATERDRAIRFVHKANEEEDGLDRDFIAFLGTGKRKREDDDDDGEDGPRLDYRGLGDATHDQPADPDAEFESDSVVDPVNAEATARNSALVRRTKDHPEDLQAWLDLVEHQDTIMKIDRRVTELRSTDKQHLADVRISIFEEALRKVGKDETIQIKLYCDLMTEAARAWSETQLASKWTEILTKYPTNTSLWLKYLDFVQSSFTSFKYEACKDTIQKCLEAIQLSSMPVSPDFFLYLLNRLTSMIHQAGYQEFALAIWQALLEYHMLATNEAHQSAEEAMQMFEEFWESEVPRIGENGAKGWRSSNVNEAPPPPDPGPIEKLNPSDDVFESFRKRETDYTSKLRYPGRTTDELGEDDAFHTVLFSDIEPFLRLISHSETPLLSAFLQFCCLPPLLCDDTYGDSCILDPFLQTELPEATRTPQGLTEATGQAELPQSTQPKNRFDSLVSTYSNCLIKRYQSTAGLLFDQGFPDSSKIVEIAFVRRVLKLLADNRTDGESIGEYLLALELKYFPTEAFKSAKQLLKARPTSLRLYNAYGLVESRRNNSAKADQVFSAALSMQKADTPLSTSGELELFYNWTWEALRQSNQQEALRRLLSPTGKEAAALDNGPNQTALLRARRSLAEMSERALLSSDFFVAAMGTSLMALLAYLSGDENPEPALAIFAQLSTWFTSHNMANSSAAELHAQYVAQFLTYHAGHAPIVKPSLLRESLEPLVILFPNNTILLSTYAANEARFSVDDRVRSIIHRKIFSNDKDRTIVGWAFAIHYEKLRGEIAGSTSHSVRALYRKAEDDVGAHCLSLWKQHVLFEIDEARKERMKRPRKKPRKDGKKSKEEVRAEEADKRVKDTFFGGLTSLPWCKEYMMMAFTHLGEDFLSREDLRKVYNVMVEKELRLYIELADL
ncbi:hypothetical protein N0V90_011767 [Kalmusia sp. IMI 367209]|nr:hypothetical protein N0V90_011767 [Kalmusia sp. IMI 367209]